MIYINGRDCQKFLNSENLCLIHISVLKLCINAITDYIVYIWGKCELLIP